MRASGPDRLESLGADCSVHFTEVTKGRVETLRVAVLHRFRVANTFTDNGSERVTRLIVQHHVPLHFINVPSAHVSPLGRHGFISIDSIATSVLDIRVKV
jgi:hypothetical protein